MGKNGKSAKIVMIMTIYHDHRDKCGIPVMLGGGRNDDGIQTFPGYISVFQYIVSKDVN